MITEFKEKTSKTYTNKKSCFKDNLKKYIIYFMLYSFIGWLYEVILEVIVYKIGYSDRGVLFGPYCIVYGTGALILLFSISNIKNKKITIGPLNITPVIVFFSIVAITTFVELLASYIMEISTGGWMWDYTVYSYNFQGRIALNPSLRFGIGGTILLYFFQPLFEKFTNKMSDKVLNITSGIISLILITDILFYIFKLIIK